MLESLPFSGCEGEKSRPGQLLKINRLLGVLRCVEVCGSAAFWATNAEPEYQRKGKVVVGITEERKVAGTGSLCEI